MKPPPVIVFVPDDPALDGVEFKPEPKITICPPATALNAERDYRVKPKKKGRQAD